MKSGTGICQALAVLVITLSALPLMADPCQTFKDRLAKLSHALEGENQELRSLKLQLQGEENHTGPWRDQAHPGQNNPPPNPDATQAQINTTEQQIKVTEQETATAQQALKICEEAHPPVAVAAFTAAGIGTPDPQIAVGLKYFAAIDTSDVGFYNKSDKQLVFPAKEDLSVSTLFGAFFTKIDKQMNLPANVCNTAIPKFDFRFDPTNVDPANPKAVIPGCIYAAYDSRIIYDEIHHRFFIAAALRNALWRGCEGGAEIGGFNAPKGKTIDPQKGDPTKAVCHTDWNEQWAHRFIAVAISQGEDLSLPFNKYALVDDYRDWPQMTVNGDYLLLNHAPAGDTVEIFNASDLGKGVDNGTSMKVTPLLTLHWSDFQVLAGFPIVGGGISLVNGHGPSNGLTYMISSLGNLLLIFAIKAPDGNPSGKPTFLKGTSVDLGHELHGVRNNPVFRNNRLYIAGFECTGETVNNLPSVLSDFPDFSKEAEDLKANTVCKKYVGRLYRVPVSLSLDGSAVQASGPGSEGFLDYKVGADSDDHFSYENTMVEVTDQDDMVYAFEKVGLWPGEPEPASVGYAFFYHSKKEMEPFAVLQNHIGDEMPVPPDPGQTGGIVDLGGIALAPDGKTVWISHAYSKAGPDRNHPGKMIGFYTEVIGAVKP